MSRDGYITIYAPYNELTAAYRMKFPESKMWGVGFQKEALKKAKLIGNAESLSYMPQQSNNIQSLEIKTRGLDFAGLDLKAGEVFAVVPGLNDLANVCYHGSKTVNKKKFNLWWCKGLRNDCCGGKNDKELKTYLDGNYGRFYRMNYLEDVKEQDQLPQTRLIDENDREYSLLNMPPEELENWSRNEVGTAGVLF